MARRKAKNITEEKTTEESTAPVEAEVEEVVEADEEKMDEAPAEYPVEETGEPEEEKIGEVEEVAEESVSTEVLMDLKDAAERFIVGYKPHHYPSIEAFGKTQGFTGKGTAEQCKVILRLWGARVK